MNKIIIISMITFNSILLHAMDEEKQPPRNHSFHEIAQESLQQNLFKSITKTSRNTKLSKVEKYNKIAALYHELATIVDKNSGDYIIYTQERDNCWKYAQECIQEEQEKKQTQLKECIESLKKENYTSAEELLIRFRNYLIPELQNSYEPNSVERLQYDQYLTHLNQIQEQVDLKNSLKKYQSTLEPKEFEKHFREILNLALDSSQGEIYQKKREDITSMLNQISLRAETQKKLKEMKHNSFKNEFEKLQTLAQLVKTIRDTYPKDYADYIHYQERFISLKQQQATVAPSATIRKTILQEAYLNE